MAAFKTIQADQFLSVIQPQNAIILDVRSSEEVERLSLTAPFIHVPVDEVGRDTLEEHGVTALDTPIYVLCHMGPRARTAANALSAIGFTDLTVIEGGIATLRHLNPGPAFRP